MVDLSAGQLVADKYRVEGVIGAGGMGIVLAATHLDLDQPVAIKVLRDVHEDAIARFQREARLIVRLKSVHVARVFDVGVLDDDTPYIVMERLEGEDLSKVFDKRGPLSVEQAVDYVLEACEAVAEAHTLGVVHRDLKPANLFVARGPGGTGSVKVLDFGISKSMDPGAVGELTNEGVALGSPGYMAPEQIQSSRDVDERADIYSIGAILYRLVSGELPHRGDTLMGILASMASVPLRPLGSLVPLVPPAFAAVVERCLAQDPSERPASVAVIAQELSAFGSRRAKASTEQILATMGVASGPTSETVTVSAPLAAESARGATALPLGVTLFAPVSGSQPVFHADPPPMLAPTPRPARPSSSMLPLGLAFALLAAVVGWVAFSKPPAPRPPTTVTATTPVATETATTTATAPLPVVVIAPVASTPVEADPSPKPSARATPSIAKPPATPKHPAHPPPPPPPATTPKKPADPSAPPSLVDMPGGRH